MMGQQTRQPGERVECSDRVRLHPDTALSKVGGRWMAATADSGLHTFEGEAGEVSEVGERIIELIDGERSVSEIADVLVSEFDVAPEQAASDTLQFIGMLISKKIAIV